MIRQFIQRLGYGIRNFMVGRYGTDKLNMAILCAGLAASLAAVGYVSGNNVVQTEAAVKGIYYVCNAIPTICYALILIGIGLIFNLDKKKTDRMYAEMAAKREAK